METRVERKAEIHATIMRIDRAIAKHRELARWGNVESKARIKELRYMKCELENELKTLN